MCDGRGLQSSLVEELMTWLIVILTRQAELMTWLSGDGDGAHDDAPSARWGCDLGFDRLASGSARLRYVQVHAVDGTLMTR